MFNFRNCQTVFAKWLHHFLFPPAMYKSSNFTTFLPTLVTVHLFSYSHSVGWKIDIIVVSIWISLLTNDDENFLMGLFSVYVFLLRNVFKSFALFRFFLLLTCKSSLNILDTRALLDMICKYFSPSPWVDLSLSC